MAHNLHELYEPYIKSDVLKSLNDSIVRIVVVDKIYNRKNNYMWETLINALKIIQNENI